MGDITPIIASLLTGSMGAGVVSWWLRRRTEAASAVRQTCESCAMTRHEVPVRDDAASKEGSSR